MTNSIGILVGHGHIGWTAARRRRRGAALAALITACGACKPSQPDSPAGRDEQSASRLTASGLDQVVPGPIAVADMTGDGAPDVIVAGDGVPLQLLVNTGRGQLAGPAPIGNTRLADPTDIAIADHNQDGHPDVFVALHESRHIRLFLGDGTGGATEPAISPIAVPSEPHLHSLSVGDVNGDGRGDLVTDSWADDKVYVHTARADGSFDIARVGLDAGSQPRNNVRFADVDVDGNLDIVTPAWTTSAITVLLGDGTGSFRPAPNSPLPTAAAPFFVALLDLDGDGVREILAAHRNGSWSDNRADALSLIRLDADRRLRRDTAFTAEVGRSPTAIEVCNLDNTAGQDAVITNGASKDLTFLYGSPTGAVHTRRSRRLRGHPLAIGCLDLDGDNRDDVVVTTTEPAGIELVAAPATTGPEPQ